MAQAGMHAMVGAVTRKWAPKMEWLMLGIVLGNLFPDMDNVAVAVATVIKTSTEGLHRTLTHSIFTAVALAAVFYVIGSASKTPRWKNFGIGFGAGILMHILLDLALWFNGVELLWPIRYELNFWGWFVMPDWLDKLLLAAEFLFFGLFFQFLHSLAVKQKTDADYAPNLRSWAYVQYALFILFIILLFLPQQGVTTLSGAMYLLSLFFSFGVAIRMRKTMEAVS